MDNKKYIKPSTTLLNNPNKNNVNDEEINKNIKTINEFFKYEKINAKVSSVYVNSAISVYELVLGSGTKIDSVIKNQKDLAFSLGLQNVDFLIPIPGKTTIGIEIPNKIFLNYSIRELFKNYPKTSSDNIIVPLGKDALCNPLYLDIVEHFHILVTGCQNSGKSNLLNSFILSVLMKYSPDDVRLILIDPKISEFNYYIDIPHLLTPIITDPLKTTNLFNKLVIEMDERLETFSKTYSKNIKSYNSYIDNQLKSKPECGLKHMPYILVVIDSFQDILLYSDENLTQSILKLIYDGEKAGIHLIISINDTADFYSNKMQIYDFVSIISFKTRRDDGKFYIKKAKDLSNYGDAYIKYTYSKDFIRFFPPLIEDNETMHVCDFIKMTNEKATYTISSDKTEEKNKIDKERKDILYDEALYYAIKMGQISTSLIQRKYSINYNRAARIMDMFEEKGIVGPANGSKPREVLVKLESNNDDEKIEQSRHEKGDNSIKSIFSNVKEKILDFIEKI